MKVAGLLVVLGSTGGCVLGAAANSDQMIGLCTAAWAVGFVLFVAGRLRDG